MRYKFGDYVSTPKFYGKVVGFCRDEMLIENVAGFRYWHKMEQEMALVKIEDLKMALVKIEDLKIGDEIETERTIGTIIAKSINDQYIRVQRSYDKTYDRTDTSRGWVGIDRIIRHTPKSQPIPQQNKDGCKWKNEQFIVTLQNPIATNRDLEARSIQTRLVETEANQYARRNTKEFPTCGFGGKVEVKPAKEQLDPSKIKFVWFCGLCGSC